MYPTWLTTTCTTFKSIDTRLHRLDQLLYHTYLISTIHRLVFIGVSDPAGSVVAHPTAVAAASCFHLPFSDEMPISSHQRRTHIACSRDVTDAHSQFAPVETRKALDLEL
jgi:hypothetical protein